MLKLLQEVRLEKISVSSPVTQLFLTLASIALALITGLIFLEMLDFDGLTVYFEMFTGAFLTQYGLGETVVKTIPLILCGLAVGFAAKVGLWNIGAEGQFYMGTFAATGVALYLLPDAHATITIAIMVLAGMLGGALWGLIGVLPLALWRVNEVITTLMLNYIGILWVDYLIYGPWRNPKHGFPFSVAFGENARLPVLGTTRIHLGLVFALVAVAVVIVILRNTRWGFEIKAIGENRSGAEYAGIPIVKNLLFVMMLSGSFAGIAGMAEVSGICHRLQPNISPGYGYSGIIVAWLARINPLGILIMSFFLGGLLVGGFMMQVDGLPAGIVYMLQATILFFVLASELFAKYRVRFKNQAVGDNSA
ncbi:MAG: ABC transporter permease [candidate division Zixibacteria bacterium]|nr:ABC transporter permease [candidate division Zixibacteria bacterium]